MIPKRKRVHFCGIGGTAMVAGARLALEAGWEVRGSDMPLYPPTSEMVAELGVPVAVGYDAANLNWGPDLVIIGNALSRGNPEVEAVLERRLHYVSLPEWLKDVVLRSRRPVVICGTHGKTTTAALTAFLLDRAGFDPGFLIGGRPVDFLHSARLGREGRPFVIEGDEYDTAFFDKRAKFFHYLPETAVVTSIEFDHGDIYPNLEAIEQAFRLMLRQIPRSGRLILCADDPRAAALADHAYCDVLTYGLHDSAGFRVECTAHTTETQHLKVFKHGARWGEFDTPLWGVHNLRNTLAALAVADSLGVHPDVLREGLRAFRGVRRRMEVFLDAKGGVFVDDFAHHPTAIRETVRAARSRWPNHRLRVVCEPRSNTMVTNRFQNELADAFHGADEVWLGPLHRAESIPENDRLDRAALAQSLVTRGIRTRIAEDARTIAENVWADARPGDVVLILSNGAFGGIYGMFREMARGATAGD